MQSTVDFEKCPHYQPSCHGHQQLLKEQAAAKDRAGALCQLSAHLLLHHFAALDFNSACFIIADQHVLGCLVPEHKYAKPSQLAQCMQAT